MSNELAKEYYDRGLQYFNEEKWDDALEILKKSVSERPHYADAYNLIGQVYVKKGRPEVAKRCWLLALKFDPDNELAKGFLAELDVKPKKKTGGFNIKILVWPIIVVILLATLITTNLIMLNYINELKFDLSAARIARDDLKAELAKLAPKKFTKSDSQVSSNQESTEQKKPVEEDLQDYPNKPIYTKPTQAQSTYETDVQVTEAYQKALQNLQSGQFDNATKVFQQILAYPNTHEMKVNAQYWLAECYYAQKDYNKALPEFEKVKQNFPNSNKVFDAEIKTSLTYLRMGDKENAGKKLQQIAKEYPGQEYKSKILELSKRIQDGW